MKCSTNLNRSFLALAALWFINSSAAAALQQNPVNLEVILAIQADRTGVTSIAFSPDGSSIASGGWENAAKLWDAGTGAQSLAIDHQGHGDLILDVAFSPDGSQIVTSSRDYDSRSRTVKLWDAASGAEAVPLRRPLPDICHHAAFSPDGSRIAAGCFDSKYADRTLQLWDPRSGAAVLTIQGVNGPVAFSPDGSRVTGGHGYENYLKLWDTRTGQELLALRGYDFGSVAYSPDGGRLASGSRDGTIRLWDARTGQQASTLKGHTDSVNAVAFGPDGSRLVSGSKDGTVRLWEVRTGQQLSVLQGSKPIEDVAFSPDGSRIASAGYDGMINLWQEPQISTGRQPPANTPASPGGSQRPPIEVKEAFTVKADRTGVTSVAISPDDGLIGSGGWENTVKLWDSGTGRQSSAVSLQGSGDLVLAVAFSPDSQRIISGSRDYETQTRTVKILDVSNGSEALTLQDRPANFCDSVAFSQGGNKIISGCWDARKGIASVRLWDARTGAVTLSLEGQGAPAAFSPDGRRFVSGSPGGLTLRDSRTGQERSILKASGGLAVAFSRDGRRIAGGTSEGTIKVWDAGTGEEKLSFQAHGDRVNGIAFSPGGDWILSGSQDGSLGLREAFTGEVLWKLQESGPVSSVAFSEIRSWFVRGSDDGTIRRWDIRQWETLACWYDSFGNFTGADGCSTGDSLSNAPCDEEAGASCREGAGGTCRTRGGSGGDYDNYWVVSEVDYRRKGGAACPDSFPGTPKRQEKIAFVTSERFEGNLGGISGADAKCQRLAAAAGLSGQFKAWISDSNQTPLSSFSKADVPYVLTDGTQIAPNWAGLVDGRLDARLNRDEFQRVPANNPGTWTGTTSAGKAHAPNCSGWTGGGSQGSGVHGCTSTNAFQWTECGRDWCHGRRPLYCFQQ